MVSPTVGGARRGSGVTRPKLSTLGKPLALSPEDLDLAATVTTVDTVLARALWLQYAPPRYVDLLDALADDFIGAT